MQLLTGLVPKGAVEHIAWLGVDASVAEGILADEVQQTLQGLHESMALLWEDAVNSQQKRRRGRKARRDRLPVFNVGDTVLVAQAVRTSKLAMTWTGPHEVLRAANPFVFEVRPCVAEQGKRKPQLVHIVRMRRFANAPLGTPADAAAIEAAARHDYPDNIVQKLLEHRREQGALEIRVRWLGFDRTHDTWEPLARLAEDVPELVEAFLYEHRADGTCARALRRYFPGARH